MGGWIYVIGAVFVVPVLIARFLLRGSWPMIGLAYALWFGFLLLQLPLGAATGQMSEMAGWAMILALYLTIPVVSALVLVMKLVHGLAYFRRRFGRA